MQTQAPRFHIRAQASGALLVIDSKDSSIVCAMNNAQRPREFTRKMAETMTAALNNVTSATQEKRP